MNPIKRLIYVPTLRCNCACKHCGQSRYFLEEECECGLIRERLLESGFRPELFSVTGGEPFLKAGLPKELAKIVNDGGCLVDITTNGVCVEAVREFADQVKDASKLLVSVSIDGMPETHDRIRGKQGAFDRAVTTVRILKEHGIPVKINTVIQRDNVGELDRFADHLRERAGEEVEISWIPLISEINGEEAFPYGEEETAAALSRVSSEADQAYLLSNGAVKIKKCHAGQRTAVISPSGKVYACLTGFSYKDIARREDFLIGDLKAQTLDEIAGAMGSPKAKYRAAVCGCEGCWNPCEVAHETTYWGMRIGGAEPHREREKDEKAEGGEQGQGKGFPLGEVSTTQLEEGVDLDMSEEATIKVNVEEIMQEIRRKARMEEDLRALPSFEDIPIAGEALGREASSGGDGREEQTDWSVSQDSFRYVNTHYEIPYYWYFPGNRIKVFLKRVVRRLAKCLLLPIVEMQNTFNAHVVRCLNGLKEAVLGAAAKESEELSALQEELQTLNKELERLKAALSEQAEPLQAARLRIDEMARTEDALREELQTLNEELERLKAALSEQEEPLQTARLRIDEMARTEGAMHGRLDALEEKVRYLDRQSDAFSVSTAKTLLAYKRREGIPDSERAAAPEKSGEDGGDGYTVLDYFKFQNDFRGTRSTIMKRQEMYLPYFRDAAAPVLDIGCGRGEFLTLMREHDIQAVGVDLYPEYTAMGELNGLDIRQGDGIAFLKETDTRFGGIFACQVIEHISFEQLQELCKAAYEKLIPGAYLVLETPNPTCLSIFTSTFYVDPTHNKPVHPLLLEYVLREAGFKEVRIVFSDVSRTGYSLPHIISEEISNLDEVNAAITRVSDLLYGCLDYSVIARK